MAAAMAGDGSRQQEQGRLVAGWCGDASKCRRPKQGRAIQWERSVIQSFLELAGNPPEHVRRAAGSWNGKRRARLRATTVLQASSMGMLLGLRGK